MSSNYIDIALKRVNSLFKDAENSWGEEFSKDAVITDDEEELLKKIEEKPKIIVRWEKRLIELKKLRGFLKAESNKVYANLYVDMIKNSEINFTQRELEKQVKANEFYVEIMKAIEKCDILISQVEEFLNHIRNLHWDIKNMIEIKKLIYGAIA